jgi:hypothetical protein
VKKPKPGDTAFPIYHQQQRLTGTVVNVARKWMTVTVPYTIKVPIAQFEHTHDGHWVQTGTSLAWEQRRKALVTATTDKYRSQCRYCDHIYTDAGIYAHREVDKHMADNHVEQYLDLLGGGDG